jgi:hypothetical protein
LKKFLIISAVFLAVLTVATAIVGFAYWHSLKDEPQYALASIVDASRRNDNAAINELVDSDAVVDSLVPQITEKAVDIYGRGLPKGIVSQIAVAASPLIPGLKTAARAELPNIIRRETERVGDVSFPLLVVGAPRYLDIRVEGDNATVKDINPENATQILMTRRDGKWRVTGIIDDKLTTEIAQRIGQEIIKTAEGKTNEGINNILKQIEKVIR